MPADRFDAGRGQQASHDGISDLVFDDIGGLAGPTGADDDLNIGDIGQRVQGDVAQGPVAGKSEQRNDGEDEEAVARAEIDDARDHLTFRLLHSR